MYYIKCHRGYSLFGECAIPISKDEVYDIVGESIYFPGTYLMECLNPKSKHRVIVPKDRVYEISSINFVSDAASS